MRAILAAALAAASALLSLGPAVAHARQEPDPAAEGRALYTAQCASCHGPQGAGTEYGPPLVGVGEAAVDFQLRTGRMPLASHTDPTRRKPPAFDDEEIALLVAYVGSFGVGPEIPRVDLDGADLVRGTTLFLSNCAPCHGATGNGGAVGGDAFAPSLRLSAPLDVAEAMITGPGEMPRFGFSEDDRNAVVAYVEYLKHEESPGGLDIGGIGPVSEGYAAWALAMAILVVIVAVLLSGAPGKRNRQVLGQKEK